MDLVSVAKKVGHAVATAAEDLGEDAASSAAEDEGDHIVLGKSIGLEERAAQIGGRRLMNDPIGR